MLADVPVHPSLSLLLLLLPFVWLFWRSLALRFAEQRSVANALAVGLAVFANVLVTHVVGLIASSATVGLVVAIAGPGALGLFACLRRRTSPRAPSGERARPDPRYVGSLLFALLAMLPTAVFFDYHDLTVPFGHMATASQILNGVYPPRSMSLAAQPWVYHYGIDQLFASVTALLRVDLGAVVDGVTLALWVYTAHLFGLVCRGLFGKPYDSLGVWVGCFCGGLPWLASYDWPSSRAQLQGIYTYAGYWGNPPVVSNFFQYPWALGLPLILFVLLVLHVELARPRPDPVARRLGLAMLGLALLTLSFSQTVGFLSMLGALALWAGLLAVRDAPGRRALVAGLGTVILLSVALLPLLGGMLGPLARSAGHQIFALAGLLDAPAAPMDSYLRFWRPTSTLDEKVLWNIASFGLLPVGLLCLFTRRPPATRRLLELMALLFAVSFLAMNLFYYVKTWDIVKFAVAATAPLAILCVGTLQALVERAGRVANPGRRRMLWGGIGAWLVSLVAAGILFQSNLIAEVLFGLEPFARTPARWRKTDPLDLLSPTEAAAIGWLRHHIRPGEMVLCAPHLRRVCAIVGGFPQAWIRMSAHLSAEQDLWRHGRLLRQASTPEGFKASGVCWAVDVLLPQLAWTAPQVRFVAAPAPDDVRCSGTARVKSPRCRGVTVTRLCPDVPSGAR